MDGVCANYAATSWAGQTAFQVPNLSVAQQQYQPETWSLQQQPSPTMSAHATESYDVGYAASYMTGAVSPGHPPEHVAFGAQQGPIFGSIPVYGNAGPGYDNGSWYEGEGMYGEYDEGTADSTWYDDTEEYGVSVSSSGQNGGRGPSAQPPNPRPAQLALGVNGRRLSGGSSSAATGGAATGTAAGGAANTSSSPFPGAVLGRVKEGALVKRPAVEQLARSAPIWVAYFNYTINGPTGQPGVLTSEQLIQAFANRRVHGHTMLVGLDAGAQSQVTQQGQAPVPPAFLRPLVFYLAMAHAGLPYSPITAEQLTAGAPPPGWCLPGSVLRPKTAAAASTAAAAAGAAAAATAAAPLARWDALAIDAAVRHLLSRAPYWCLLTMYSDSGRWSCPQNMTATQLRERLRAGHSCLYACVLGTIERLPNGAWIPTSMVLPLGVLLQTLGGGDTAAASGAAGSRRLSQSGDEVRAGTGLGLEYAPPSAADVRYFIEDAVRAVQGRPEAAARLDAHLLRLGIGAGGRGGDVAAAAAVVATRAAAAAAEARARLDPFARSFVPQRAVSPAVTGSGPGAAPANELAEGNGAEDDAGAGEASSTTGDAGTTGAGCSDEGRGALEVASAGTTEQEAAASGATIAGREEQQHQEHPQEQGPVDVGEEAGPRADARPDPIALALARQPQPPQLQVLQRHLNEQGRQHQQQPQGARPPQPSPEPRPPFPPHFPPDPRQQPGGFLRNQNQQQHQQLPHQEQEQQSAFPQQNQQNPHHQQQQQQHAPQGQPPPPGSVLVPIATPFLRFETAVFRLFQGDEGQHAFSSLWWYIDPAAEVAAAAAASSTAHVLGPYSCEQMILAYIAQLLPHDALVCGTQSSLAPSPPPAPPHAAFAPLGSLLAATEEGHPYALLPLQSERATPSPPPVPPPVAVPVAIPYRVAGVLSQQHAVQVHVQGARPGGLQVGGVHVGSVGSGSTAAGQQVHVQLYAHVPGLPTASAAAAVGSSASISPSGT